MKKNQIMIDNDCLLIKLFECTEVTFIILLYCNLLFFVLSEIQVYSNLFVAFDPVVETKYSLDTIGNISLSQG